MAATDFTAHLKEELMNNPMLNMSTSNSKANLPAKGKDYPSEVKEVYQRELKLFDTTNCRVRTYVAGLAECLTPGSCHYCGNSVPFANTFFCRHPLLVKAEPPPAPVS